MSKMAQLLFFLVTATEERGAERRESILGAKLKAWHKIFHILQFLQSMVFGVKKLLFR